MGGGGWDRDTDREGWGSELTLVQGSNNRGVKKKKYPAMEIYVSPHDGLL